jgi:hypothetical protein
VVEIFAFIKDFVYNNFYIPFTSVGAFQTGCYWGLVWAFLIGTTARIALARTGPISSFFRPTPRSFTQGPSPFSRLLSCVVNLIIIAVMIGVAALFFLS